MHNSGLLALTALVFVTAACSPKQNTDESPASNAGVSTNEASSAAEAVDPANLSNSVLTIAATEENIKKGKIVFLRCRSCHTLEAEGIHLTGPNLHGLFGAKAGEKEGYTYSDAITSSDITWNEATLSAWFENPQGVIKGNVMAFPGLPDEANRHALIAYLRDSTAK